MAQNTGTHTGHSSKIAPTTTASANNNGNGTATSNPGNTMMAAGKLRYCSIFAQYQRLNQQTLTPWRESNDAVQQAGGWMALAHEARAPETASMSKHENCPPGMAAAFTQGNLPLAQAQTAAALLQNPLQQADAVQLALRNSPAPHAARQRTQQAQLELAAPVIAQVTQVRQAWVRAVAAQQSLAYARQVYDSAQASAELARRMQATGNFSKLMRVRQQVFYAAAATQLATSQHQLTNTREELVRALGLNDEQAGQMRLPQRLPDLPSSPRDVASVNANTSASAATPGATNSQLREQYSAYRTHYDIALHYRDEVVPLHKTILDENVLRYNGMLSGVFEVLSDAREQISSVIAAINATQDFWLADATLQASIVSASEMMNSMNATDSTMTGSKP